MNISLEITKASETLKLIQGIFSDYLLINFALLTRFPDIPLSPRVFNYIPENKRRIILLGDTNYFIIMTLSKRHF